MTQFLSSDIQPQNSENTGGKRLKILLKINRSDHEDIVGVRHFTASLEQLFHVIELDTNTDSLIT